MSTLPLALHIFSGKKLYLSQRTGPGTWELLDTLYDDPTYRIVSLTAGGLSANPAFTHYGIAIRLITSPNINTNSFWLGNSGDLTKPILSPDGGRVTIIDALWESSQGGYWFNNAYYAYVNLRNLDTSNRRNNFIKTDDDGATFTELDAASPKPNISTYDNVRRSSNNIERVYWFGQTAQFTDVYQLDYFDMNTGMWHGTFGPLTDLNGRSITLFPGNGIVDFPNGDIGVFYYAPADGLIYRLWTAGGGGSWGPEIIIEVNSDGFANIILDPDLETMHITDYVYPPTIPATPEYRTVNKDGSQSGVLFTWPTPVDGTDGVGQGMIYQGNIYIPFNYQEDHDDAVWVAPNDGSGDFVKEFLPVPPGEEGETASCAFLITPIDEEVTTQTLELTKIVSGGPASPEDFTVTAVGGSPEVEISGDGHVGPTEVSPGVYELSETDNSGAQWGSGTWGTSKWGSDYRQGNWDCGGAFMPTPTSVQVAPGSGGDPFIAAVQVAVDPTYRALLSGGASQFKIGSNLYQVLFNSTGKLGIFKRAASSSGSSWTLMDTIHAPGGLSGNGKVTQRGTTIGIAYLETGNLKMHVVEFDTTTDTYGIPSIAYTLPGTLATFCFVQRSDNTYIVLAAWSGRCYYIPNTGGTWGALVNILNPGGVVLDGVIDSSNRIWFLFNSASTTVLIYQLSASFVLSSSFGTVSILFPGVPYPYIYYPQIALWGTDGIAVAWNTALTIGSSGTISVKTLTPLSAPVVTTSVAYTFGTGTERAFLFQPVDDGSGNLNLFLVDTDTGVNKILQTLFDGSSTWGAPTTFYDAVSTPPPSGIVPSDISALFARKLTAGWTAAVTMQTMGPTSTGEYVELVTPTNNVACTITNTFSPTPPPPGPGIGEANPVGCFELLRVDVTLTPSRHLPTRGSTK